MTSAIRGQTAIVGAAISNPIRRHADVPLGVLAVQAVQAAAADAGISASDIDGMAVYPSPSRMGAGATDGIDYVGATFLGRALGLNNVRWCAQVNPGSFVGSIAEAANAVASGACKYAVAWRAMYAPAGKFGRYSAAEAEGSDQFIAPYGLTNYAMQYSLQYSRYLSKYGATRDHLATYIVNNRENAAVNPEAIFYQKPVTRDEYLNGRVIAEPFNLLDCDMPVDVCSAVIITSADVAKDLGDPVYILGYASLGMRRNMHVISTLEDMEDAISQVGRTLWASAGIKPSDINQANLYDGFSPFILYFLEGYGICGKGEAFDFIQGGRIQYDGELPINISGGSLGMGRLHGGAQIVTGVRQIRGTTKVRQVPDTNIVVAGSGNPNHSHGSIVLSKHPSP